MDFRNASDKHMIEEAVKAAPENGIVTPVGAVTPDAIGQIYVDTVARVGYVAVGMTSADWLVVTP